jgi:hypothetical protein
MPKASHFVAVESQIISFAREMCADLPSDFPLTRDADRRAPHHRSQHATLRRFQIVALRDAVRNPLATNTIAAVATNALYRTRL